MIIHVRGEGDPGWPSPHAHMCVKVGGGAWSIGPWSACGGFASRAPMTRRHVVATGGFQRGGVPADGHPFRGATKQGQP